MTPAEFRTKHRVLVWSNPDQAGDFIYLRKALLSTSVAVIQDAVAAFGLTALAREWALLTKEGSEEMQRAAQRTELILHQLADGACTSQIEAALYRARGERVRRRRARDYSEHLNATYALLAQLREAQERGDRARVAALAEAVDWEVVADEFETVAGRACCEIRERATRILTGLVAQSLAYADVVELRIEWECLAGALDASPSLRDRSDQDLQDAWQALRIRDPGLPDACPWSTLAALRQALDAALVARGLARLG
ncbi:hypothetical protein AWV79_14165 [Cupriavidus sp. UYMMa02A]|nr:hypothetical protein AWV79_14165 [Cupriavidus sp. UYMMa02A]